MVTSCYWTKWPLGCYKLTFLRHECSCKATSGLCCTAPPLALDTEICSAAEQISVSRASGRAGQGRTSDIVCAKGYTIGKLAKYGTAYATADGVSSFVSKQSWTNRRLLQLQLTEQALQSASSSGKLQQYLPTMTAVSMWIGKDALTTESATAQLQTVCSHTS